MQHRGPLGQRSNGGKRTGGRKGGQEVDTSRKQGYDKSSEKEEAPRRQSAPTAIRKTDVKRAKKAVQAVELRSFVARHGSSTRTKIYMETNMKKKYKNRDLHAKENKIIG